MNKYVVLFLAALFMTACTSTQKMVEKGDYDTAINSAVRGLQGKKKKKTEDIKILENAFAKANDKNLNEVKFLKEANKPDNWNKIYSQLLLIRKRQALVEPLLPLVSEDGYQANFQFVRVEPLIQEAEQGAAEYHYAEARRLIERGENGDKVAAKRAYEELLSVERFFQHFKDKEILKERALMLGTNNVLLEVVNRANVVIPTDFERELKRVDIRSLENEWTRYYTEPQENVKYDYIAAIVIDRLFVSPEQEKEVMYIDEVEVKEGFNYVLDSKGNVMKDSLGNDIKTDKFIKVRADVNELFRFKKAEVAGKVEYKETRTGKIVRSRPVFVETVFESYASRFSGDKRALSEKTKKNLRSNPMPFPSDLDLTLQAAEKLKGLLINELRYEF